MVVMGILGDAYVLLCEGEGCSATSVSFGLPTTSPCNWQRIINTVLLSSSIFI